MDHSSQPSNSIQPSSTSLSGQLHPRKEGIRISAPNRAVQCRERRGTRQEDIRSQDSSDKEHGIDDDREGASKRGGIILRPPRPRSDLAPDSQTAIATNCPSPNTELWFLSLILEPQRSNSQYLSWSICSALPFHPALPYHF